MRRILRIVFAAGECVASKRTTICCTLSQNDADIPVGILALMVLDYFNVYRIPVVP